LTAVKPGGDERSLLLEGHLYAAADSPSGEPERRAEDSAADILKGFSPPMS